MMRILVSGAWCLGRRRRLDARRSFGALIGRGWGGSCFGFFLERNFLDDNLLYRLD